MADKPAEKAAEKPADKPKADEGASRALASHGKRIQALEEELTRVKQAVGAALGVTFDPPPPAEPEE